MVTTSAIVWDGQTVVLGGLIAEDNVKSRDKVPVLGDIPVLGRLFRSENSKSVKKNLMIFVTATIIDPAGKRVHSSENLPYDPTTIPSQTASAK
jgi:general secretion pathway protein D